MACWPGCCMASACGRLNARNHGSRMWISAEEKSPCGKARVEGRMTMLPLSLFSPLRQQVFAAKGVCTIRGRIQPNRLYRNPGHLDVLSRARAPTYRCLFAGHSWEASLHNAGIHSLPSSKGRIPIPCRLSMNRTGSSPAVRAGGKELPKKSLNQAGLFLMKNLAQKRVEIDSRIHAMHRRSCKYGNVGW